MDDALRIHLVWQAMQRGEISPAQAADLLADLPDDDGDASTPPRGLSHHQPAVE